MQSIRNLCLLFHTVRHLTMGQLANRAWTIVRKLWRLIRKQKAPKVLSFKIRDFSCLYEGVRETISLGDLEGVMDAAVQRAIGISRGRFSFLNREVQYQNGVNWHDTEVSRLWRYHLHYFDYVEDLIILSLNGYMEKSWRTFKTLSSSWISNNEFVKGDGWHPYTVSLRIVNWLNGFGYWRTYFDSEPVFRKVFLASLYGQARFLAANLEYDVRGNHLLKNIKALLWAAGAAFYGKEPSEWRHKAIRLLEQELAEQVFPDGGHFERVPGYHGMVLKDCLEIALWMKRNGHLVPAWLDDTVLRMLSFLKAILPLDGRLPLLKDTAWDSCPAPLDLLSTGALYLKRAEFKLTESFGWYPWLLFGHPGRKEFQALGLPNKIIESKQLVDSGFFVLRDDKQRDYLIFDVGKPCPDYLPAHAHADMFSYELMVDGKRVVVDSGVFEYAQGRWRDFFRSTRAHNTVEVQSTNQSEVWDSFRVARRARPLQVKLDQCDTNIIIDAHHDGYQRLSCQAIHRRVLFWGKIGFWLVFDEMMGKGCLKAKSHIHFHPSCELEEIEPHLYYVAGPSGTGTWIQEFGNTSHELVRGQEKCAVQGWFSEKFGYKVPNSVLSLKKKDMLPFGLGYVFHRIKGLVVEYSQTGPRSHHLTLKNPDGFCVIHVEPEKVIFSS